MPAAPPVTTKLSRKAPTLEVRLGPADGSAPTARDVVDFLQPSRIERSIGGTRLSAVTLKYDLGKTGERIVDTLVPKGITRQIEVRELDEEGNPIKLLLWGKLAAQPVAIDGKTQSIEYVVRIDKHLLGSPLIRTPFWNPIDDTVADVDRKLVFNPEVDDKIVGNCSNKVDTARGSAYCFCDVLGPDTAAARTTHEQTLTKWKIFEAVHRVCWLLNGSETYVKNPTLDELQTAIGDLDLFGENGSNTDKLRNLVLQPGEFLPELLDKLLLPFGAAWYIALEIGDAGESIRRLKFFVRNKGAKKQLFLQRSGTFDPAKSSLTKLGLKYDIASLANKIIGSSAVKQREITLELYKGWPVSEDSLDRNDLLNDAATKKAHPHAGRLWILNESGAYTGLRPEITTFTNLATYLGTPTLPLARKFLPCLSRVTDAHTDKLESRGIVVEYWSVDEDKWKPLKGFSNLLQQCGIWLDSIPVELWSGMDTPDDVKVRVTATIEGDRRQQETAARVASSPNADDVPLYLPLDDKFHDKDVHSSSQFYADRANADTSTEDQAKLQAYIEKVRSIEDAAELSCSAEIEGIDHPEYQLGDLITRVNGLNIDLIRSTPVAGQEGQFLQIVGINLDVTNQRTELLLETFDEEKLT